MIKINEYFPLTLDAGHTLVSTRHGGWSVLSNKEYDLFKSGKLNQASQLFENLEKAGIVLTERNTEKTLQDLKIQNSFLFYPTNYHVIAVTNQCNANCVYCHPKAGPEKDEMDESTAKKVLDFIFSIPMSGGVKIIFEGGEPLLKWDLIKSVYARARQKAKEKNLKLQISFTTNLSLMTDEIAQSLAEMGIHPCASFDGPKELHDQHRPLLSGEGSYEKTVSWIRRLKNDYQLKVYALPVITNISLGYGPEAIIDEYLKIGQEEVFFKPFRANGRAINSFGKLAMKPENFFNFWKRGIDHCISLNKKGVKIKELNAVYFINNILSPQRKSMCHRGPCGAGLSILSYTPDGTINACDAARGEKFLDLGHVDKDDYQSVRAKAVSLLNFSPDLTPVCSSCPFIAYCGHCLADTFGRGGKLYMTPESFQCQWQKLALEYIFKKIIENGEDAKILRSWQ